jgi:gas vesicle protein
MPEPMSTELDPSSVGVSSSEGSGAKETAKQTATASKEQAQQVAETASEGAKRVASEASRQAGELTSQATDQARQAIQQATSQLKEQADGQTQRAASSMRTLSDQLSALTTGRPDEAGAVGDYARQAGDKLQELAGRLETRGLDGVVEDLQRFARRRPGVFLAGAGMAGFVVGRLVRGAKSEQSSEPTDGGAVPQDLAPSPLTTTPAGLSTTTPAGL